MNIAHELKAPVTMPEAEVPFAEGDLDGGFEQIDNADDARLEDVRQELRMMSFVDEADWDRLSTEAHMADQIDIKLDKFEEAKNPDQIGDELKEKKQGLGEILGQINENVEGLDQSAVTKEELLLAMLMLYELSKEDNKTEQLSLFEILVKALGKMLISLVDQEVKPYKKDEKVVQKRMDIDDLKSKLLQIGQSTSIENKAA